MSKTHEVVPSRGNQEAEALTPAEALEAIRLLTKADHLALKKYTLTLLRYSDGDIHQWEDMIQDAIAAMLTAERKCPRHVRVRNFLCGIVRSQYWAREKKRERRYSSINLMSADLTDIPVAVEQIPDGQMLADQRLLETEKVREVEQRLAEAFAGDPEGRAVFDELLAGRTPEEIKQKYSLDQVGYESTRRRGRRRIDRMLSNRGPGVGRDVA
jgi:DNA-directed RNA polymerase specialized sigma24 family protein